ncbi:winged helix-turn-helix transcriptional regulator [Streptomyces reniochalinae]|uniref:Transcriptional regulator n=1 Tax=Streptomyces reniochalinae TaxID=2250578 RepID=A0A367E640_9ACTN|nr:helix-turn-helix domain-containing protein [Streptomyces reniochalinae]RCG13252.1 transcriptional regulator [Streptomyces reniochalinae]
MGTTSGRPQHNAGRARVVLGMVGDKWSLLVVCHLDQGPRRFTELKRAVDGISQRMLTVTLRGLERDGLVTRTVHHVMPPNVTYRLTPMGRTLYEATTPLLRWTVEHLPHIDAARAAYDARGDTSPTGSVPSEH